jgi:hypothetical protein
MTVETGTEAAQFLKKEYMNSIFLAMQPQKSPPKPKKSQKMFAKTFSFCLHRHAKIPYLIKEGAGTAGIASSWPSQQLQPPFKGRFFVL